MLCANLQIFGPEASGKTTLALHAIAETQKAGGKAVFIDAEHAFDVSYAKNMGIMVDDLLVCQPDYGEMALNIANDLLTSDAVDLVAIDSVSAMVPKSEIDGEIGSLQVRRCACCGYCCCCLVSLVATFSVLSTAVACRYAAAFRQ